MTKRTWARLLISGSSFLLQLGTLCFHTQGAANNDFANAQVISGATGTTDGDNVSATREPGEPDHAGNAGGASVWFRWTAPASGSYSFNTGGSAIDTVLAVYTGASVSALNLVASNDDFGPDLTSAVSIPAVSGVTYHVAVDGYDGEFGDVVLNWSLEVPPLNDNFADATPITGSSGTISGHNSAATQEPGEPNHAGEPGGRSVWFRWTAPADGVYSFDTSGSSLNTLLAVYTGASVNALSLMASNDDSGVDITSAVSFSALNGVTYHFAVDGYAMEAGALTLNWSPFNDPRVMFTTLHHFTNSISDGSSPQAGLVMSGDTLYGTTVYGGASGNGTVFRINADGSGFTNLHSFNYTAGANPYAKLVLSGSTLYGTTYGGGSGYGIVFAVGTNGTGFTNLHSFPPPSGAALTNAEGANPIAGLVLAGNTLFGTARSGGTSGKGTVFAIGTDGSGFTNLHHFTATGGGSATNSDGAAPTSALIVSAGTLYGTANAGGNSGYGTIFAINTNGNGFTVLHSFDWTGGANPHALTISASTLYGTANAGGPQGLGAVFAINTNGTGFTIVYAFTDSSGGANPFAGLMLFANTLYGTALGGGKGGKGTVFALGANGAAFTTLHHFTTTSGVSSTNSDGASSRAELILSGHTLYGTTERGGASGQGTIFSVSLPPLRLTIVSSETKAVMTWPAEFAAFTLQSTTNLALANSWLPVAQSTATNGATVSVDVPATAARKFFRLVAP